MNPRFRLEIFEGPLDLLLHLIKKEEVEISEIPVARITEQYLEYMQFLEELNLDLAGEYLVMAATLTHIKSRLMLPPGEGEEEGEDPIELTELKDQLAEYQRIKMAAVRLNNRELLHRDVFRREPQVADDEERVPPPLRPVSLADLVDALREVLRRLPTEAAHEIMGERVSLADRIPVILDRLRGGDVEFTALFGDAATRAEVVVTFLALLELVRTRIVRAAQGENFGPIVLSLAVRDDAALLPQGLGGDYKD
jgi:segregation and condensation protein A